MATPEGPSALLSSSRAALALDRPAGPSLPSSLLLVSPSTSTTTSSAANQDILAATTRTTATAATSGTTDADRQDGDSAFRDLKTADGLPSSHRQSRLSHAPQTVLPPCNPSSNTSACTSTSTASADAAATADATAAAAPAASQPATTAFASASSATPASRARPFLSTQDPAGDLSDLPEAILEEGAESGSDSAHEPLTPTSADGHRPHHADLGGLRKSLDHTLYLPQYNYSRYSSSSATTASTTSTNNSLSSIYYTNPSGVSTKLQTLPPVTEPAITEEQPEESSQLDLSHHQTSAPIPVPARRSTLRRTMSSLFRRPTTSQANSASSTPPRQGGSPPGRQPTFRVTSHPDEAAAAARSAPVNGNVKVNGHGHANGNGTSHGKHSSPPPPKIRSRFSFTTRSAVTTRSNTPPSPGSPLEPSSTYTAPTSHPEQEYLPEATDFDRKKKTRSSTGLSLRGKTINFLSPNPKSGHGAGRPRSQNRRASSFSFDSQRDDAHAHKPKTAHANQPFPPERLPWAMPPDAGTGAKARRMSLSLPDDFNVDVVELTHEFEYQSKLLGRHGKHLGKGAASKVTLMARKGCPDELFAVKEFRGKSHRESKDDYDKKIKSEFSIAKSLHHPNIVETIRLCTDHARWNHVMEYCGEGDLFGLVSKGWLKDEARKKDRLCLFKQLIQGVNYLHEHGIAHRDIKLENLLITKDSKLKITDFGVSEVFCGTHPGLREAGGQCGQNMDHEVRLCSPGICGSEPYIAPEVLAKRDKYDPRPLDVWSTAIVMIYLTFGGAIWTRAAPGNEHFDALVRGWDKWHEKHDDPAATITEDDYPHHKAFDLMVSPPALRRLMLQMLHPDPARRIAIKDVLNHRWMRNVECCQLESYDDPTQVIDATKSNKTWNGHKKIFCHSHLPPKTQGNSLGKMPGQPGY